MNTVALKAPQIADTNTKVIQDRIYAVIEAGKKQVKKLSWLFERHPGFVEKNAWDGHFGLEVRRMRW
jgi:hypothetical protein